jgi:hypothetical protein
VPLGSWNRADEARCGTGVGASHVDLPACHDLPKTGISPAGRAPLAPSLQEIQRKMCGWLPTVAAPPIPFIRDADAFSRLTVRNKSRTSSQGERNRNLSTGNYCYPQAIHALLTSF